MTNASTIGSAPAARRTPWHLWGLGGLSLPWNAFGCWDYLMTQTKGAEHLRQFGFTDVQVDYMLSAPPWAMAVWALGVWPSLLGSVLLLLRSRFAFHAFAVSAIFFGVSLVYQYVMSPGLKVMGFSPMSVVIAGLLGFFIWYARATAKAGVLR